MKNKFKICFGIGAPSILMIFVSLCLTTLAALALITTNANYNLAKKSAEYIQAYYSADCTVEDWICETNESLSNGKIPEIDTFKVPISDTQALEIKINIVQNNIDIISQKIIITKSWNYSDYETNFSDIKTN